MANTKQQFEEHVIIAGVGLIGGSIAAAIRQRFPDTKVTGIGRDLNRLKEAKSANLLTDFATELTDDILKTPATVVICLPVHLIANFARNTAAIASADTLITDAGSVKSAICQCVAADPNAAALFVGAHPIAGGEQAGFEHSDPDLFVDNVCVITHCERQPNNQELQDRAIRFWESIGCTITLMTPEQHDQVLALTSHLPHIMAAVTTSVVGPQNLAMTGSGFRDTTRIAAGSPSLWKEILLGNTAEVISAISQAENILRQYRTALQNGNSNEIENLLVAAAECRSGLGRE